MTMVILTRISEMNHRLSRIRYKLIIKAKRTYKIPQKLRFFYYMIADGLAEILNMMRKKVLQIVRKSHEKQLSFDFAKNYEVNL